MKFRLLIILTLTVFSTVSCGDEGTPCGASSTKRTGAVCNDGTRSSSTGSGTCSSHGGVDYWLCS